MVFCADGEGSVCVRKTVFAVHFKSLRLNYEFTNRVVLCFPRAALQAADERLRSNAEMAQLPSIAEEAAAAGTAVSVLLFAFLLAREATKQAGIPFTFTFLFRTGLAAAVFCVHGAPHAAQRSLRTTAHQWHAA